MSKLLQGEELEKRCIALGVNIEGSPRTQSSSGNSPRASDFELQRRLLEAERSTRESRLWLLALISSVKPDLALLTGTGLLLDAKYKGRSEDSRLRIADSDLYESLAFATAAKRTEVLLLYPSIAQAGMPAPVGTAVMFESVRIDGVLVLGLSVEVRGIAGIGALSTFARNLRSGCESSVATQQSLHR